ncbi:hypothetical protein ACM66B_006563 [Microbotryomycetes sp. NB124-2]
MDHHCPWLFSCVGWANYKFFILFLVYSAATGTFVAATTIYELVNFVDEGKTAVAPVSWAFVFFEGIVFGFAVGSFALYHLYLACSNRTTIESMEGGAKVTPSRSTSRTHDGPSVHFRPDHDLTRQERWQLEKANSKLNIYDLGWKRNLSEIFGGWDERWSWLLPVGWPPGDGTTFPINRDKLEKLRQITADIRLGRA